MTRKILHLDMDAFFASVEQADNPELRGKPVMVGGGARGVVSTASYEARRFGVHSAMPIFQAKKLCPQGILVPVRMKRYREVSGMVMEILHGVSPLVEKVSIDEAFVDITGTERLHGPARELAAAVKSAVKKTTSLTCSVGIAPNKYLAKIASDLKKPDGLTIIEADMVEEFLRNLPVRKIPGVGRKTEEALGKLGVVLASDVLRMPLSFWIRRLGKVGAVLYDRALGKDDSPVEPHSEPKSISAEETFPADVSSTGELEKTLLAQAEEVGRELRGLGYTGRTVTLKIKFSDFKSLTRSRTLPEPFDATQVLFDVGRQLLLDLKLARRVRLIGIGISNLSKGPRQMTMASGQSGRDERLDRALDHLRSRFCDGILVRGRMLEPD
ncbi:MAG: DNA polymerase IV [Desulfobacteraceae bacterium]|nr:DNA polymerase IV [Desulfobacteraceae bacterium]